MLFFILTISFFGPHSADNIDLFYSSFKEFNIAGILLFSFIFILIPSYALYDIFWKKHPFIINEKGLQISKTKFIDFKDVIYICLANDRHQSFNNYCLKIYYKEGKEELISINDLKLDKKVVCNYVYYFFKKSKM